MERSATSAVGEEAELSDTDQAARQNVKHEAAQELMSANCHDLLLPAMGIVSPAERDAMSVAGQVVENMFGAAERRLGVDDAVLLIHLPEKTGEAAGSEQMLL